MSSDLSLAKKLLSSKYTAIAILIIVSIGVYLNTLSNEFVYDDEAQVLKNLWIKDVRNVSKIFLTNVWAFIGKEFLSNYYRPLMHMIYMIDYHIFGLKPWGFHLTNIIFHAGVTVLVFIITSMLINQSSNLQSEIPNPAFIAALLFAVHPIHTEAVSWIAGVPELLFTFFYLLSFYLYIYPVRDTSLNGTKSIEEIASAVIPRFNRGIQKSSVLKNTGFPIIPMYRDGKTNRDFYKNLRIKRKGFILSVFFFFLAALSKETALTLPILLFVYDYSISKSSVYGSRFTVHGIFKRYLPYLIVSIIYFILRTYALGGFAPQPKRHEQLSNYEYVINAFPLFIQYLEKLILPINMNIFYAFHPISSIFELKGIITLILTLAFIFLVYFFRRRKIVFLCLSWIVIPLLPVFYIPAFKGEVVFAERYLYLPSIGFVVLAALAIERIYQFKALKQIANYVIISMLIILTGLYSIGTIKRNYIWKDNYSLWTDSVEKSPDSYIPHHHLGNAYYKKGEIDRAIEHYQISIKLKPEYHEAHNNLGVAYYEKREVNKAIEHYEIAIKLNPNYDNAYNNLGIIYFERGEIDKAIEHYQTALKLKTDDPDVYTNLGNAYSAHGRFDDAIKEYTIALKLNPDLQKAHYNLALTYSKQGRFDEAIKEYLTALRLKPDYPEIYNNLGIVYARQGRFDEAIKEYLTALKLKSDYPDVHLNLGNVYAALGKLDEAIKEYTITLNLKPDYIGVHYNLGLVYLKTGLRHKAEEEFKTALKLRPDFTPAREALESMSRER